MTLEQLRSRIGEKAVGSAGYRPMSTSLWVYGRDGKPVGTVLPSDAEEALKLIRSARIRIVTQGER